MEYSKERLDSIWKKGIPVEGYDPSIMRKDACGAWILRESYGETESDYCWDVDHIYPVQLLKEKGFDDSLIENESNLRPLNKKNIISKSNSYPEYKVTTIAEGERNIDCEKFFTVNKDVQAELSALYTI